MELDNILNPVNNSEKRNDIDVKIIIGKMKYYSMELLNYKDRLFIQKRALTNMKHKVFIIKDIQKQKRINEAINTKIEQISNELIAINSLYNSNNIDIKLPVRKVEIYSLELLDFDGTSITFKTKVSKGTYIRSLIEDICNDLNTIGTMSNLIRTKQGNFSIEESYTLNDIENGNYKSLSIHEFLNYPSIEIPDEYLKLIINGNKIPNSFNIKDKVIFTKSNKDYAIYINEFNVLKPYIMLNE